MFFWVIFFVALTIAVVLGVIAKRRIERQETMLGIRLELLEILKQAAILLSKIRENDLKSRAQLEQIQKQLELLLTRIDKVEETYGMALAKQDTDSDAEMITHLLRARGSITMSRDIVRSILSRPNASSKQ